MYVFSIYTDCLHSQMDKTCPSMLREAIPKKICSYLDIVKIALTPLPAVLDTYKELCRKKCIFFNSASNNLDSCKNRAEPGLLPWVM